MNVDIRNAVFVFARMSGWIVAPVFIGLFVGRAIDVVLSTAPYGLLVSIGICFVVSIAGIIREAHAMRDDGNTH